MHLRSLNFFFVQKYILLLDFENLPPSQLASGEPKHASWQCLTFWFDPLRTGNLGKNQIHSHDDHRVYHRPRRVLDDGTEAFLDAGSAHRKTPVWDAERGCCCANVDVMSCSLVIYGDDGGDDDAQPSLEHFHFD